MVAAKKESKPPVIVHFHHHHFDEFEDVPVQEEAVSSGAGQQKSMLKTLYGSQYTFGQSASSLKSKTCQEFFPNVGARVPPPASLRPPQNKIGEPFFPRNSKIDFGVDPRTNAPRTREDVWAIMRQQRRELHGQTSNYPFIKRAQPQSQSPFGSPFLLSCCIQYRQRGRVV